MTDENPLLDDDGRKMDRKLRELFDDLAKQGKTMEDVLLEEARRSGRKAGLAYSAIGSNVAMAYFHAGLVYAEKVLPHRHEVDKSKHSAAYFDGFTEAFWVDVTDKQKKGPYT